MNKRTDKRVRLVEAADKLFFEQGVNVTTLANIAALAEVPLGNVYYYFKSKESIVMAVIARRRDMVKAQFAEWNNLNTMARLKSLITYHATSSTQTAIFGDWLGSICQELCKQTGDIASSAAGLLKEVLQWCETQFKELGKGERSEILALNLLSGLQGISLLTLTFKDPKVIEQQSHYLIKWVETV
jgi:TetR/AcrR family transcriptional regulator, transcriptional repressor for nem operon